MKFFKPVTITDATLLSSSVPETESGLAVWSSGTTYSLGQKCFMTTGVHKIYESLQAANLNKNPTTEPTWWVAVSPTNRWKMFDQAVGTNTVSTASDITIEISLPGANYVDCLGLLDMTGVYSVTVQLFNPSDEEVWSDTYSLYYFGEDVVPDWYWYFLATPETLDSLVVSDIPYRYDSWMRVKLSRLDYASSLSVGTIAVGTGIELGCTQWGVKLGILDFSKKETDELGVTTLLRRVFSKTLECSAFVEHEQIPRIFRALSNIRATPVIWIGSEESLFSSTIVYGFYRNFDIVMEASNGSYVNLDIEGLA